MHRSPPRPGLVRRFLREYVRPYLGLQTEIGACLLIGVVLELVDPLILKAIVDRALGDGDLTVLTLLVGILLLALIFRVAFRLIAVWLYSYSGLRILFEFRQRVFEHVERQSPLFFRGEHIGDILARLTSDIDILQRAAAHTIVNAVKDLLTIAGILSILFWLDPTLTLILLCVYPVLVMALAWINRRLRAEGVKARQAIGDLFSFLEERITGMRLIQEFLSEKREARRHVQVSRPWIQSNLALSIIGAGQISLADLMSTGAFILVFLLGGARVLDGSLTLGSLIAYYTLASRLYRPIAGLIDINVDLQLANASLARIYWLLDHEPDVAERPDAIAPPTIAGNIRMEGVSVIWPDGTCVLDEIHLSIPAGELVAIVGPSGSGKSTLAAVISRTLDPQHGTVSLDDLDLMDWNLKSLRRAVGLVPQETQLFHDTIAGNLRLASPHSSDDELREAMHAVELGEYLSTLPEGLATQVGEQGLRLSGGERQRIALARALLKAPMVHILDEATSALDPRTERRVLESFRKNTGRRTTLLIAHRLTCVANADKIFVLARGKLVESGTHDELYRARGLYRTLYDEQLGQFRPHS